jgi:N,N'-diacetyllegionaminate synthase
MHRKKFKTHLKLHKRKLTDQLNFDQNKPLLIAEVGINHNGNFNLAKKSTIAAFNSGADIVKFQNFKTEDFLNNKKILWLDKNRNSKSLFDICKKNEFQKKWMLELNNIAKHYRKKIFYTPTSISGIKDIKKLNIDFVKNGSDFLTHIDFLSDLSKNFTTIFLSTGMATIDQIHKALDVIERNGKSSVILMHCVSLYPTEIKDANINRMTTLKKKFKLEIGYSDHTKGTVAPLIAASLGAKIIEKHFTLDKKLNGPDHWFSSDPKEFKKLSVLLDKICLAKGSGDIMPNIKEMDNRHQIQVALSFSKNTKKNTILNQKHFKIMKNLNISLQAKDLSKILKKKLNKNKLKGEPITLNDVK